MPGEDVGQGGSAADKTFTQSEVDALIAERNKAIEANRNEVLNENRALKEKYKAFEGVDLEEHKKLKAEREKADRERQEAAGNFKALETQLLEKHNNDKKTWETELTRYRSAIDNYLIDSEAVRELADVTESPDLLLPHVKQHMKVFEENGKFVARIVDANHNIRIGKGAGATPMTLSELLEEMKQDKRFALAFKGTGSSGGGASRSNASGGGHDVAAGGFMQDVEKIASGQKTYRMAS